MKRSGMDNYQESLLKKCKEHGGPVVTVKELKELVKRIGKDEKILKSCLRTEVGFKRVMHPLDATERPHLYKMNHLSGDELLENLRILMDVDGSVEETYNLFPSEEEPMDQIVGQPDACTIPN